MSFLLMLKVSMVLTVDFESVLISSKLIWKIPIQEWFKSNEMHHFRFRNGSNQKGDINFDSEMAPSFFAEGFFAAVWLNEKSLPRL